MEKDKQSQQKNNKPEADLIVPTRDLDPEGKPIYHPAVGRGALWGGILGGILLGLVGWLVGSGIWPVAGLGQISSGSPGSAAFFGFVFGSGFGGLAGSINGLKYMLINQEHH